MSAYPVAKIDLSAVAHNLQRVKTLAPTSHVMSVIKADAYGHGAIEIASALSASDAFAVARLSEAIQLRESGIQQPIVILEGVSSTRELERAANYAISIVFHSISQLEILKAAVLSQPLTFCWLMLETGMHRLGFNVDEANVAIQMLSSCPNVSGSISVMSHFANADERGDVRNHQQLELIQKFASQHRLAVSMANSAAILSYPESHANWLRPGLMLYGISPFSDKSAVELGLKPVMKLCSHIIAIKNLQVGDQVGYGGDWVAKQETRIAIINIGYGDGYSRQLSNIGSVLIKRGKASVLGRVSMDMLVVNISDIKDVELGDEAILWGNDLLPVEQVAQQAKTIPYELVCQLNQRVKRTYHRGED